MGKINTVSFWKIFPCGDTHKLREEFIIEVPEQYAWIVKRVLKNLGYSKRDIVTYRFTNVDDLPF